MESDSTLSSPLLKEGWLTSFFLPLQIPQIFYQLQTSVQAVLLGTVVEANWTTQGVPSKSQIESWPLPLPVDSESGPVVPCLTGDGQYLYVHGTFGLMKVGTGHRNTVRVSNVNLCYC